VTSTSDAIAGKCIDVGWIVISTTSTTVICEAPMNVGQSALTQLLIGNSYSTPPKRFMRFNIAGVQGASRVQANGWVETQMAFGQMQRQDFSGPEFHNSILGFLTAAGGRLPPGTTFPNHVMLGVELAGDYTDEGALVGSVDADSPADRAGIRGGDRVRRLAGERIKSEADWWDGAARAARDTTYEVEIVRSGERRRLTLERAFRPPVIAPVIEEQSKPEAESFQREPVITTSVQPISIADELAKFAQLRDKGVITEEEFQEQKARLLKGD
jgi:hypothetical protein